MPSSAKATTYTLQISKRSAKKSVYLVAKRHLQLGAYLEFASSCYPGVYVTKLVTIIAGPGKCKVRFSELEQATEAWIDSWGRFPVLQPDF